MSNTNNKIIECQKLCKSYTIAKSTLHVLDNLDFSLCQGEFVAIMGPSGSGKSTLLHCLAGLDKPNKFNLFNLLSDDMRTISKAALRKHYQRNIGFMHQMHYLLGDLTAIENLVLACLARGQSQTMAKQKSMAMLNDLNILAFANININQLSGGQRQRVAFGRALINNPKIVFADEPTGNLDKQNTEQMLRLISEVHTKYNTSFLLTTHNQIVASAADKVYYLADGQLTLRTSND